MSDLVAIAYDDLPTAQQVASNLGEAVKGHDIELDDLVIVERKDDGDVKLHQPSLAGLGAASGALWGGLIGLVFFRAAVRHGAQVPPPAPPAAPWRHRRRRRLHEAARRGAPAWQGGHDSAYPEGFRRQGAAPDPGARHRHPDVAQQRGRATAPTGARRRTHLRRHQRWVARAPLQRRIGAHAPRDSGIS